MAAVNLRHIEIFHAATAGNLTPKRRGFAAYTRSLPSVASWRVLVLGLALFERTRGRLHRHRCKELHA